MALKGFTWWRTYCDVGEELTEKEQKDLYFAIVRYLMYDDDREAKLTKNVRIAFKCIKPNLKTSRSRSESGKRGGEARWSKDMASSWQDDGKRMAKEWQVKDKDKDKVQGRTAPAACPKCGGPLQRTNTYNAVGLRLYRCSYCYEEVFA